MTPRTSDDLRIKLQKSEKVTQCKHNTLCKNAAVKCDDS